MLSRDEGEPGRYNACFAELLKSISEGIAAVPRNLPLSVRLQLPSGVDQTLLLDIWRTCWEKSQLRPAHVSLLSANQGLLALDEWLDIPGGPTLEKFTLFVSAQLHETPPEKSAEAAVALLLNWAPLAERHGTKPLALLHRPVENNTTSLNDSIATALLWGRTTASQVDDLWQAELESPDKPVLVQGASDLLLGVSKTDDLCGMSVGQLIRSDRNRYSVKLSQRLDTRSVPLAALIASLANRKGRHEPVSAAFFAPLPLDVDAANQEVDRNASTSADLPLWHHLATIARKQRGRRVGWHPVSVMPGVGIGFKSKRYCGSPAAIRCPATRCSVFTALINAGSNCKAPPRVLVSTHWSP
jgi:hypothetical protein